MNGSGKARSLVAVVVVLIVIGFLAMWWRHDAVSEPHVPSPASSATSVDESHVSKEARSAAGRESSGRAHGTGQNGLQQGIGSVLMDYSDLAADFGARVVTPAFGGNGVATSFYALSREEASWMDAQGAWRKDGANFEPYANLSLDELAMRARQGDVSAAVFGAQKCRLMALSQLGEAARDTLMHGTDDEKRRVAGELFASELWNKQRELLWDGVTYGSSIAADLMSQSYTTLLGSVCLEPESVGAWGLVSWRMGNWHASPMIHCNGNSPNLSLSMQAANRWWDRINYLRAERGLGPLPLNLRPNHAEWLQLRLDPRKQVPVYRR